MDEEVKEHAERFDEIAEEYDEDKSEEYLKSTKTVIDLASPNENEVVLDIGTGTGAIALELAKKAKKVIGVDVSKGMLEQAKKKKQERSIKNIEFKKGSFLDHDVDKTDIIVTNFAMHHLNDEDKLKAIRKMTKLNPRKIIVGDLMFFKEPSDEKEPFYEPEVDDPARVNFLLKPFTEQDYAITEIKKIHNEVGVLVAEKNIN